MTKRIAALLLLLTFSLFAADPDFTIMVTPDTQYMVFTCSPQVLNVMMNWIVANKNADQGGVFTTNLKAVIGLGDVAQQATAGEYTRALGTSSSAYGILDANNICYVGPTGNHDYANGSVRTGIGAGFKALGFFSASYRSAHMYQGGGVTYGGAYTDVDATYGESNYYVKLRVGATKFLIFCVEYQPRGAVLDWVKGIQDANYGWSAIVTTHSYLSHAVGKVTTYTDEPGNTAVWNDNGGAGLATSQTTSDTAFNSGYGMWNSYLKNWPQLSMVLNGHLIAVETHYLDTPATYLYNTFTQASTSARGQTVNAIFTNWQDLESDNSGGEYPTWTAAGTAPTQVSTYCAGDNWAPFRLGHVMLLQVRPSAGVIDGYIASTTNAKWEPLKGAAGTGAPSSTPVKIFTITYAVAKQPIFPMGASVGPQ